MTQQSSTYPVQFSVDFPARPLDRVTTFFRIFMVIPILIVAAVLDGGISAGSEAQQQGARFAMACGVSVFLATLLMLVFRQKYPRWWFDWSFNLTKFGNRIAAYLFLLRDEYPSTDEEQAVHTVIPYPDARTLNRWLPLVKWLLAIPHFVILIFLTLGAVAAAMIAWFAILFTSRYPRGLFDYVVGVGRWWMRVAGYAILLVTDRYPPFSLNA